MDPKYDPTNLALREYQYSERYKNLNDLPPPEEDEESYYSVPSTSLLKGAIEERGLLILITKKLLIRLLILFKQIKSGNNSYKLPHESRQIVTRI